MDVVNIRTAADDPILGTPPAIFFGDDAVDGTVHPWSDAPLGSMYIRRSSGNVAWYMKKNDTGATTDWKEVTTAA